MRLLTRSNHTWLPFEDRYLLRNPHQSVEFTAFVLDRSIEAVRIRRFKLGIRKVSFKVTFGI